MLYHLSFFKKVKCFLKRKRLQGIFWVVVFLLQNIYSKTFVSSISLRKYAKRTKKLELNVKIEFGGVVLSTTILISKEKLWDQYCAMPCSKGQHWDHPTLSCYPTWLEKSLYKGRTKIILSCFCLILLLI